MSTSTLASPTPGDGPDLIKIFSAVAGWPTDPLDSTELAEVERLSRRAGATKKQIANRRLQWTTKRDA